MSSEHTAPATPPVALEVLEELARIELPRGRLFTVRVVRPHAGLGKLPRSIWIGKQAAQGVADALAEFAARSW